MPRLLMKTHSENASGLSKIISMLVLTIHNTVIKTNRSYVTINYQLQSSKFKYYPQFAQNLCIPPLLLIISVSCSKNPLFCMFICTNLEAMVVGGYVVIVCSSIDA